MTPIVRDETELPSPSLGRLDYVRLKSDPTLLIACKTGECFTRKDGKPWEWPAYLVTCDDRGKIGCEPWTAFADLTVYDPDGSTRTAQSKRVDKKAA